MQPDPNRREEQKARRKRSKREKARARLYMHGKKIPVDPSKLVSCNMLFHTPEYYEDKEFHCCDCGQWQLWTASQQKWWYEIAGGNIETTASRCRECRKKERERKAEARKIHQEGLAKKGKKPGPTSSDDPA